MSYFADVTFDLHDASEEDYEAVTAELAKIGLAKTLQGKGDAEVELPFNTYAGEFDGDSAAIVADSLRDRVAKALQNCGVHGKVFVAVGGNWAWRTKIV